MEAQPQKAEIELEEAKKEETNFEDQLLKTKERILRLKELSMKLKSSNGLQELENERQCRLILSYLINKGWLAKVTFFCV
ncbi:Uncharacterised protein [Mycobacterium tuberculosis]|nr:Uncharacterised protein [Mycobacterium tuberculosis]